MDEPGESGKLQSLGGPGQQRRVFISYSSHDAAVAQNVCSALEPAGYRCWIAPRDVVPGTLYADGIVGAIDESRILVLILSKDAVASAHVGKELERATSKRHPIIALRLDTAPLTRAFEYFLNESQWIDVGGGNTDAAIAQLVSAAGQHLAPGAATSPTMADRGSAVHRKAAVPRRTWLIGGVVVTVALAAAYFLVDKAWHSKNETTAATAVISDKSVAVLPFVDMSEKKDQEYFSDGLSEELIDKLTKISELRVPARTSSFFFKGKQTTIGDIAKALSVAYVLEGSVRKSGQTLRITAQLIKADAGFHVWSETYDRKLDDVFKVQDEIAGQVVRALKVSLLPGEAMSGGTRNIEANDLYMHAGFLGNRPLSEEDAKVSVALLSRALTIDPNFALAWAELSRAQGFLAGQGLLPPGELEAVRKASHVAADRAVALNPLLSEAHAALGVVYLREQDLVNAASALRRALELNPRSGDALQHLGSIAGEEGRLDEQVTLIEQALAMDPLSINILDRLGYAYLAVGKAAAAETIFQRQLELSPQNMFVYGNLGMASALLGRPGKALDLYERGARHDAERRWARALLYPALGRKTEADSLLVSLERDPGSVVPLDIAEVYAYHNEKDRAFEWLERQYRADPKLLRGEIHADPFLANLRGDPRFKALLRKLNLPE